MLALSRTQKLPQPGEDTQVPPPHPGPRLLLAVGRSAGPGTRDPLHKAAREARLS